MEESKGNDMSDEISDHYEEEFEEENEIDYNHQNVIRERDGNIVINKKSDNAYQTSNEQVYENAARAGNAYSSSTLDLVSQKNQQNTKSDEVKMQIRAEHNNSSPNK